MTGATIGPVAITGAANGIGAAVARALSLAGVVTVGLDLRATIPLLPDGIHFDVDVTDEEAVSAAIAAAEDAVGPLQGLVNAAGILGKVKAPERTRLPDWLREINVDLTGTYIVARAVGERMAERRSGSIVNIASVAGMTSAPTHAYSAAKAGVISLTRTLAMAWGRRGVRVNAVSPGFTRTAALERGIEAGAIDDQAMANASAIGRLLEPEEIADPIIWLLGSGSRAVTGINLPVDAGFLAGVTWSAYGSAAQPSSGA